MSLVNRHRLAVEAIAVELLTGLVGIGSRHLDKGEPVPNHVDREYPPDHAEEIFYGSILRAVWKVANKEFLCRGYGCHLHTYADIRIIIHRLPRVKEYF